MLSNALDATARLLPLSHRTSPIFYINGRFLTQRVTGIQRYAREVLGELDGLLATGEGGLVSDWRLIAPKGRHRGASS